MLDVSLSDARARARERDSTRAKEQDAAFVLLDGALLQAAVEEHVEDVVGEPVLEEPRRHRRPERARTRDPK